MRRRRGLWVVVCGALAAAAVLGYTWNDNRVRCPFSVDRVEWSKQERSGAVSPRQRQADGLLKCNTLRGMSRADVRELLGRPDNGFIRSTHWEYVTGPHRGVPIDVEFLGLTFGDNGLVRSASLYSE